MTDVVGNIKKATLRIHIYRVTDLNKNDAFDPFLTLYGSSVKDWKSWNTQNPNKVPLRDTDPMIGDRDYDLANDKWKVYDVTQYVKDQMSLDKNVTFVLRSEEIIPGVMFEYDSINSQTPAYYPQLELETGPAAPAAPSLDKKTTTSITLQAVVGQEYSKDNGVTWQDSATFSGLTPDTDYTFVTRVKSPASDVSVGTTIRTNALPVLGGTVTISGTAKYGETLTADLSSVTYTPQVVGDVPTYQWKRNGSAIGGATSTSYTLTQDDIGKVITVTVTADGTHATGSVTSAGTAAVAKMDGPAAPVAPSLDKKTTASITLKVVAGQEYSKDNGVTWQDSATFSGLTPDTDYTFVTRVKETATQEASAVSSGTKIRTDALPVLGGMVTISGTAKYGETLTADLLGVTYTPQVVDDVPTYQWKRNGSAIGGATSISYTLMKDDIGAVITVAVTADGTHATGSVTSAGTAAVAKVNGPAAPVAPSLDKKTTASITLKVVAGQEYSKDNGVTWQDSATFSGLTPDTDYTFVTRVKETATQEASAVSSGTKIRTDALPVLGGTVTISGTAKYGETLTADLLGVTYTPQVVDDVPTYQWKRNGSAIGGATSISYTLMKDDIGAVITVAVTADGTHATGSVTSAGTAAVAKVNGPAAPLAPSLDKKTTASITLQVVAGQEYSKDNGVTWQDSATFSSLTPDTDYTFVTRVKETATQEASAVSAGTKIRTDALPVLGGTVTISGTAKYGETLTADLSGVTYTPQVVGDVPTYQWKRNGSAIGGATSTSYTLTQDDIGKVITVAVTADGTHATGSVSSAGTAAVAKMDGPAAPVAPSLDKKTTASITLKVVAGQEYSKDNGVTWQDSAAFSSLTPDTDYTFVTRVKETATQEASAVSAGTKIHTDALPVIGGNDTINDTSKYGEIPSVPTTSAPSDTGVDVLVNGKAEHAGTAMTSKRNDQIVTTILVDEKKLDDRLVAEGKHAVVTIPVNIKSDVIVAELNGQMIRNMEDNQAVLVLKTSSASYTLPAQEINIDAISKQVGTSIALQDIKIQIEIAYSTADTVKIADNVATKGMFTLVAPLIDFTVKGLHEDKTIVITKFNAYVERTIAIPDGVDPNRITTGIVVEHGGTARHVPTKVISVDGRYYAKIKSLTNSTYSVVWHPVEFGDVANHWSKHAVNDMGSRMVIAGTGDNMFSPDLDITRAEFVAIIVRGLGLKLDEGASPFSDVRTSDWYSSAINTAYTYQLIHGFENGTFRPNDKITREEAMIIISKAMKATGLKDSLPARVAETTLHLFTDSIEVSSWAQSGIADCVQGGIVSGREGATLAPKAYMTRAEVAAIIQRLLQKSDLI
ncbi:S-layer homology domain-containing protein [Paenibacillus sp. D2_2]|uniref:S-layer homology domain-containing protein n=1 Tax=Paenibacillus sp. D2_2 TaxID=3073092 RepID=UPI0028153FD0|nr:S-layer homology domain-containing protein [Paenibacillus sp. D2_2]WMT41205.1 S-layer homology domain-containing protein [Paenibacillus sp. D2_2]